MRVIHLISSSGLYGAEKMVINLCRAQQGLGLSPGLMVFDNSHSPNLEVADSARDHGIPVRLLKCHGRFDPSAVRHLRSQIRASRCDVLHTHGYKANLYGYLASRTLPLTVVSTCHRFDTGRHNTLDGPILRRFDAVAAVSDEAAESLLSVYRLSPEMVTSIPNGIDLDRANSSAIRSDHPPVVGMVGRLAPEKAPADFLTVAGEVSRTLPDVKFDVVGDGPMRAELERARDDAGLEGTVDFLGFREDVQEIYRGLTILLQPSLREGMPMTTLEAMASGVAVVATRVGALPDVIEDGRNGILVDPHDTGAMTAAVRFLLTDQAAREAIVEQARDDVRQSYGSETMARRYVAFYTGARHNR